VFLQKLEKWCLMKSVYVLDSTYLTVWVFSSSEPNKADALDIAHSIFLLLPKCGKIGACSGREVFLHFSLLDEV